MIENLISYATQLNASGDVITWITTAAKNAIKKETIKDFEVEHIIDWMTSKSAPQRLLKMSVVDAKRKAAEWTEANKKKGRGLEDDITDLAEYMAFPDGFKIVELITEKAFKREGTLMGHCLGGYSVRNNYGIYSLRDDKNSPHCTFEVAKNGDGVLQIKGKGNGSIHPKYVYKVISFLEKQGMKIRPSEMVNLGYYHIPTEHLDFVRQREITDCKVVKVFEEYYAF